MGKETDISSRRALATSNFELANLTGAVGRKQDALSSHRAVLATREALAAEPGADNAARAEVGISLIEIARLLHATGDTDQAVAAYRRSESLLASLGAGDPLAAAPLAACRSRLGWLLSNTGKNVEALESLELARSHQEPLGEPRARRTALAATSQTRSSGWARCDRKQASQPKRKPQSGRRSRSTRNWPT